MKDETSSTNSIALLKGNLMNTENIGKPIVTLHVLQSLSILFTKMAGGEEGGRIRNY